MLTINEKLLEIPVVYTKKITEAIKSDPTVVNLARGDSEFITPRQVTNYLKSIIDDEGNHADDINKPVGKWTHYEKESGSINLKRAIVGKYHRESQVDVDMANILITHGGMNAIFYALSAIAEDGDEVLIFDPAYIAYYPITNYLIHGLTVKRICLNQFNDYRIDFNTLSRLISKKTKAIVFTSPYNPCGRVYTYDEIHQLSMFCKENQIYLIHDENHEKEVYDNNVHYPAILFDSKMEYTICLNSMSRLGMGGWRVGWMIANPKIIRAATSVHAYVNMTCNTFVQESAAYALSHYDELGFDDIFKQYSQKRVLLHDALNRIEGVKCILPEGTCYLFPDVKEFFDNNIIDIKKTIYESNWYLNLSQSEKEKENTLIESSVSYKVYLYLLIKYRVGVLPGCCYGPESDHHIRLSFSVKKAAIDEAVKRLKPIMR